MRFVVDASQRARVLVSGPDAPAFLHRLSTQHVSDLKVGDGRLNAFTTDKGRLKDVVHHVVLEEGVLLLGHQLPGADLVAWLDRYLFSEKVELNDGFGGGAHVVDAATADGLVAGAASLAPWQHKRAGAVVVVRTFDRVGTDGAVVAAYVVVGAPALAATLTPADDLAMSIAAGIPGVEIGEAHTPLDLDLHDAISWNKGCYIGQEVIARLDTYGKQRKHLAALRTADDVEAGAALAGALSGTVTSIAPSAWGPGLPNALALVKGVVEAAVDVDVAGRPGTLLPRRAAQRPHD